MSTPDPVTFTRVGPAPLAPDAHPFMVRMRDGVRLATDVYLPEDRGTDPLVTVLIRLPYDKCGEYTFIPEIARHMNRRGYAVVAQDVRGKFRSEGETLVWVNEVADGVDTIDWIIRQSWSDGRVTMWGDSYYGYTQWAAASAGHPALRAMSPRVTGRHIGVPPVALHANGVTRDIEWSFHRLYAATTFVDNDSYEWEVDWSRRPYSASVERFFAAAGTRSPTWDLWAPGSPVFLRRYPFGEVFDAPAIPTLITIGWFDGLAPWAWDDWRDAQRHPAWAINTHLLVDAVDHEGTHLSEAGKEPGLPADLHERARVIARMVDPSLDFFDVFVRGLAPAESIPRVRWNLAHTSGFREATSWPPGPSRSHAAWLGADGTLSASSAPGTASDRLEWTHDPDDLVPTPYPIELTTDFLSVYPDERALGDREDVLVFQGCSVAQDTDLVGAVTLSLEVGSSGPAMDVCVRLLDRSVEDGSCRLITRGAVTIPDVGDGRHVTVAMGEVGYRLRKGHALVLHVSSSSFPEFMPQPGTGEEPWTATRVEVNRQWITVAGPRAAQLTYHTLVP